LGHAADEGGGGVKVTAPDWVWIRLHCK
jgi:hypothetical protein